MQLCHQYYVLEKGYHNARGIYILVSEVKEFYRAEVEQAKKPILVVG